MNIGDRVRMLHARQEGVITRFLENKLVEVEIEDGFRIPVLRNELVVIAAEEAVQFKKNMPADTAQNNSGKGVFSSSGVYMAFSIINDTDLALYVLNNTDLDVPFTIGEVREENYKGLLSGFLKRRSTAKVHEVSIKNFENWPLYLLQLLFFKEGNTALREPLTKKIRFRANTFFKSKQLAPLLNKDAYLFQIDKEAVEINPEKIMDSMEASKAKDNIVQRVITPPEPEVDLHIEKLTKEYNMMGNAEILQLQLQTFENKLENAIAVGMSQIIFIHGVGNGILRMEIHKRLGKNPHVSYFKDAMKEKFGYGATLAKLK